jgi:hypothetical protein
MVSASGRTPWKISSLSGDDWIDYRHQDTFQLEDLGPTQRLRVGAAQPSAVFRILSSEVVSQVLLLWVLRTSRIDTQLGRYQSPPLPHREAIDLIDRFASFFEQDARSDIWIHTKTPEATVVLEEHNIIYAYGDLSRFDARLTQASLRPGAVSIPSPHAHNYHAEHDHSEREFLGVLPWSVSPLRPEDT